MIQILKESFIHEKRTCDGQETLIFFMIKINMQNK